MELLVVLVILAIMTVIAVQATDGFVEQARFEGTQRGLQNLRETILGPTNQRDADGSFLATGFVADVGRLPFAVGMSQSTQLAELWSNPNNLPPFGLYPASTSTTDIYQRNTIMVPAGWRGPYLRLPIGSAELRDGWGNPFALLRADKTTLVSAGDPVEWVRSLGSDNASGGVSYATDLDIDIVGLASQFQGGLTGSVYTLDASNNLQAPDLVNGSEVRVKIFGPNPAGTTTTPVLEAEFTITLSATTSANYAFRYNATNAAQDTVSVPPATPTPLVSIGPRIIRAYQLNGSTITKKSAAVRLTIRAGGQTKDLILQ